MTKDKSLADQSPEDKMDRMLELLVNLQSKVNKLEQESSEIQSLKTENTNPNPVGAAKGAKVKVERVGRR